MFHLNRFLNAQAYTYEKALEEIQNGQKETHWMWYIFPQLIGLGESDTAIYYGIQGPKEAEAYLENPLLKERLIKITKALLKHQDKDVLEIFGYPDNLKLKSCMTLFYEISEDPLFKEVIDTFYDGEWDEKTIAILKNKKKR